MFQPSLARSPKPPVMPAILVLAVAVDAVGNDSDRDAEAAYSFG